MDGRRVTCALRGVGADRRLRRLGEAVEGTGNVRPQGRTRDRRRRPERQELQRARVQGPQERGEDARHRRPCLHLEELRRLHPEPLDRGAELRPRRRRRVPDGRPACGRREAVPGHEVRDRRLSRGRPQGRAEECSRNPLRRAGGRVPRGRRGRDGLEERRHRLRRRPEDPAGRPLHRGLPVLREEGQTGHQDPERLLAGLRRPGQVQGDRPEPDRRAGRRDLPGRGRLRPRRHPGGEGEQGLGHRRRRRPVLPREAGPHERPEEGRRGGLRHDQARRRHEVEGRRRRPLQREERRRRLRQGEHRGAEARGPHQEAQRLDEAARLGEGQAPSTVKG